MQREVAYRSQCTMGSSLNRCSQGRVTYERDRHRVTHAICDLRADSSTYRAGRALGWWSTPPNEPPRSRSALPCRHSNESLAEAEQIEGCLLHTDWYLLRARMAWSAAGGAPACDDSFIRMWCRNCSNCPPGSASPDPNEEDEESAHDTATWGNLTLAEHAQRVEQAEFLFILVLKFTNLVVQRRWNIHLLNKWWSNFESALFKAFGSSVKDCTPRRPSPPCRGWCTCPRQRANLVFKIITKRFNWIQLILKDLWWYIAHIIL